MSERRWSFPVVSFLAMGACKRKVDTHESGVIQAPYGVLGQMASRPFLTLKCSASVRLHVLTPQKEAVIGRKVGTGQTDRGDLEPAFPTTCKSLSERCLLP